MSVINQMLRDLDARQASQQERAGLPPQLRTLPPAHTRRPWSWGLLFVGLVAGAAIAWLLFSQSPAPAPAAITAVPEAPAAPPVQAVEMAPEAPSTPAAVPPAPTLMAPHARNPGSLPPTGGRMPPWGGPAEAVMAPHARNPGSLPPAGGTAAWDGPAPTIAVLPPPKPAAELVVKPAAKPAERPAVAAVTPPSAPAPALAVAAATGETRIDKQPKGGQTREQAEAEYRKGVQAASQGDHATALPALRRALELDPLHAKARQALLSVLASSRQWDEVKLVAQNGLALDPAKTGWATILARLQHEQGDTAGAVETLERHAAHAAGDAEYQGLFAFLLQKRQRPAEAAQRYQAALALRPGEGRWWFGLGLSLDAAGRGDEAKAAFSKARETGNLSADMAAVVEQKLK